MPQFRWAPARSQAHQGLEASAASEVLMPGAAVVSCPVNGVLLFLRLFDKLTSASVFVTLLLSLIPFLQTPDHQILFINIPDLSRRGFKTITD